MNSRRRNLRNNTYVHLRGLFFGLEPNNDPIWAIANPDSIYGARIRSWSGFQNNFVENQEISDQIRCSRYIEMALDGLELHWENVLDQSDENWLDMQKRVIVDCVVWGLRRVDSSLMGLRHPGTWVPEVLTREEMVVVTLV